MHEPRDQTEQRLAMQNRSRETHFLRLPRIDMQGIAITEMAEKVGQVQRDANLLALRCRLRWHLPIQHPAKSAAPPIIPGTKLRSEEHTSELQSLMRSSYAVFCLKKTNKTNKPY